MVIKHNYETRNALLAALVIGFSGYSSFLEPLKYLKYLLPFIFVFLYIYHQRMWRVSVPNVLILILFGYVFWSFFSLLMIENSIVLGVKDLTFVVIYILPFFILPMKRVDIGIVFKLYVIIFSGSMLGGSFNQFSLINSTALYESPGSFTFGAFALFFLTEKNWKLFFIAVFMMMLTLKRISLLALFFTCFIWYMPVLLRRIFLSKWFVFGIAMGFFWLLYGLGTGLFDGLVYDLTGLNVNAFTLGRFTLYMGVIEGIQADPWSLLWGNGIGSTYELAAKNMGDDSLVNLHSDLLKLMYENGIIFFAIFFMAGAGLRSERSKLLFLYLATVFVSDNIIIYVSVMFFILLLIEVSEFQHNDGRKLR